MTNRLSLAFSRVHVSLLAVSILSLIILFTSDIRFLIVPNFVAYHTALELICITTSFMIFMTQLVLRSRYNSDRFELLGIPFLFVGIIDLFHTFSYKGLPDFFSVNTAQKSIYFWLAARFLEAFTFLFFAGSLKFGSKLNLGSKKIIFGMLFYFTGILSIEFYFSDLLPRFADAEGHITTLKSGLEYFLILLHLFISVLLLSSDSSSEPKTQDLLTASLILSLSGLCFGHFAQGHDAIIFFGHLLKCVAYYFIFRACFVKSLEEPLNKLNYLTDEIQLQMHNMKKLKFQLLNAERLGAVGQSLGSVVHDLNNMLAITEISAMNISRALSGQGSIEDIKRYSENINKSVQKSKNLQKMLLKNSRTESPQLQNQDQQIYKVCDLLHELQPLLAVILGSRTNLKIECDQDYQIRVGKLEFEQVIMNLIVNAKDALKENLDSLVLITVNAIEFGENVPVTTGALIKGKYCVIKVKDNGTGIPSSVLPHIFEAFYSTKSLEKGTGLGLSTIRDYILDYGGQINIKTQEGQGSEFEIYFPMA